MSFVSISFSILVQKEDLESPMGIVPLLDSYRLEGGLQATYTAPHY
jgi:hypothetical protein